MCIRDRYEKSSLGHISTNSQMTANHNIHFAHLNQTFGKFRKAEATGESFKHKTSISEAVMEASTDTWHIQLSSTTLQERTQNPNELFSSIIWTRVPKNVFLGIKTLKWGVSDAVLTFNNGNIGRVRLLMNFNIVPGIHTIKGLQLMDKLKIAEAGNS